ncbi:type II toxin-antitoxin system YoeB family toxin [Microbispora amethystogenes]|uniref:type II toxin-antitoxin system YoeB family toxin n=1 Tax=Microbispora amethystogenes TaxID=1427754 RepID=UPI00340FD707
MGGLHFLALHRPADPQARQPTGIGRPEPLEHTLQGAWSRRVKPECDNVSTACHRRHRHFALTRPIERRSSEAGEGSPPGGRGDEIFTTIHRNSANASW